MRAELADLTEGIAEKRTAMAEVEVKLAEGEARVAAVRGAVLRVTALWRVRERPTGHTHCGEQGREIASGPKE